MTRWTVRIELHLIAMHAADQRDARPGLRALGDHHRDVGVLARGRLHALEIEQMLLAGLEVLDVEGGDDRLALDHVAGVGRPATRGRRSRVAVSADAGITTAENAADAPMAAEMKPRRSS